MKAASSEQKTIGVVIPAFRASGTILQVLQSIGPLVKRIVVVDDSCPEGTGGIVERESKDRRVHVIYLERNEGVGGATLAGMAHLAEHCDVLVKIDADGQMDSGRISDLSEPILGGLADYSKGTRFQSPAHLKKMPALRLLGNAGLSLFSKFSSGYWSVSDPTNGFIAISSKVFQQLDTDKICKDYFFESDLLFRLGLLGAVVREIPMHAIYNGERSSLSIPKALFVFPWRHQIRTIKRLLYTYFIYQWTVATVLLVFGLGFTLFGLAGSLALAIPGFGSESAATAGQVMLFALPLIVGTQALMTFVALDVSNQNNSALQNRL